jgi:hypothetical protein
VRRRSIKSVFKFCSSTVGMALILMDLNIKEVAGIYGVAVKCLDTIRNTDSEGRLPLDY